MTSESICEPICGDGVKVGNESCDDGAVLSGDGCSSECEVEVGVVCPLFNHCYPICGDGLRIRNESCKCSKLCSALSWCLTLTCSFR